MHQADDSLFDPGHWGATGALEGQAPGRGTTWFVRHEETRWALRHYRRGGWVARFVDDHYLWLGLESTRAWREWHLTADLHRQGLPVPTPVAARVQRHGISYTADLITERIIDAEALSRYLQARSLPAGQWRALGRVLRRFHDAGLDHADLNAHNILLDEPGAFWLIDFDKARLRSPGDWREGNLRRFERSLRKLQQGPAEFFWREADWDALRAAYAGG